MGNYLGKKKSKPKPRQIMSADEEWKKVVHEEIYRQNHPRQRGVGGYERDDDSDISIDLKDLTPLNLDPIVEQMRACIEEFGPDPQGGFMEAVKRQWDPLNPSEKQRLLTLANKCEMITKERNQLGGRRKKRRTRRRRRKRRTRRRRRKRRTYKKRRRIKQRRTRR